MRPWARDAGAHVERLWHDVSRIRACPTRAHYDVATLLLWSCLQPVSNLPIETHFRQADRLSNDEIRRDRRFPGSVGCRLLVRRHRCSVLRAVLHRIQAREGADPRKQHGKAERLSDIIVVPDSRPRMVSELVSWPVSMMIGALKRSCAGYARLRGRRCRASRRP